MKRALLLSVLFFGAVNVRAQQPAAKPAEFSIVDGDRVVFYGDSITEQRLYTIDIENFILTRHPDRKVAFFHSGVGGDKVSGGKYGPIDLRLQRDVFEYKPTVVTIMLGMNDGFYRAFDPDIFESYKQGYIYLVGAIQKQLPGARITLIKPSPFDDVTRPETMAGGYNKVLQRFGAFIGGLVLETHTNIADLNAPVVQVLANAKEKNSALDTLLIPDRIHPGPAIHWVMAESVLKSWSASPEVTTVHIEGGANATADAANTDVTDLAKTGNRLLWTQTDRALPLPLGPLDADPLMDLTLASGDMVRALDMETLRVTELAPGKYRLRIDDREVGSFSAEQLTAGVNLALLDTPMLEQSRRVNADTQLKNAIDAQLFDLIVRPRDQVLPETIAALTAAKEKAVARQRADAQPVPHHYELTTEGAAPARRTKRQR
jgi:lysophospholipase L1-like esterase